MRHTELDIVLPEDSVIGASQLDDIGYFRFIKSRKVYQIAENTQQDIDLNLIINRYRINEQENQTT